MKKKTKEVKMDIFDRALNVFQKVIERIENKDISIGSWIVTFFAIVFIRDFLETISSQHGDLLRASPIEWNFLMYQSILFYSFSFLGLTLILFLLTKEKMEKILKFILFLSLFIFLAPLIDILAGHTFHKVMRMAYTDEIFVGVSGFLSYWFSFLFTGQNGLFFGIDSHIPTLTINYGLRIEVALILLISIWYVYIKTRSFLRTFVAFFAIDSGLMLILNFPYFLHYLRPFQSEDSAFVSHLIKRYVESSIGYLNSNIGFSFGIIGFISIIYFLSNREKYIALMRNFRLDRVIHILLLLGFGIFLGLHTSSEIWQLTAFDITIFILTGLVVIFEWSSAVCYNDVCDEVGDRISMPDRPLIKGILDQKEMLTFAIIFAGAALYFGRLIGYGVFCMVLIKICLHYLYSSPIFRLKSIPIISNLVLAVTYLITVLVGYVVIHPIGFENFPERIALMLVVVFTLTTLFKDIKDIEGDTADGIQTIPVIFGMERGKYIIGFLGFLGFLSIPLIMYEFCTILFLPSCITGLIFFWLVVRKSYRESSIFILYFTYVTIISILLTFYA